MITLLREMTCGESKNRVTVTDASLFEPPNVGAPSRPQRTPSIQKLAAALRHRLPVCYRMTLFIGKKSSAQVQHFRSQVPVTCLRFAPSGRRSGGRLSSLVQSPAVYSTTGFRAPDVFFSRPRNIHRGGAALRTLS